MNLITDRTTQDVNRVKFLAAKAWQDMTEAERAEWLSPMKGAYNYTDLNRVEEAVAFVAGRLKEFGYLSTLPATRVWSAKDIPSPLPCCHGWFPSSDGNRHLCRRQNLGLCKP